jgi:hypothetical protein
MAKAKAFGSQLLLIVGLLVGCKQQRNADAGLGDSALLSHDADAPLGDSAAVVTNAANYKLDDNRYRQWTLAQERLDSLGPIDAPVRLTSLDPSPADIDRTVAFLESRPDTRNALAASGLSARDYILTTLALAQASGTTVNSDETDNERFLSQHRTDFDQVVSRSRFRVVDYEGKGKHGGGKGHGRGKHKGKGHGKH